MLLSQALLTTQQGITQTWDTRLLRPVTRISEEPAPSDTAEFKVFKKLEMLYQENLVDYHLQNLFQPLSPPNAGKIGLFSQSADSRPLLNLPVLAFDGELLDQQLQMIKASVLMRDERMEEILVQQTDIMSFYGSLHYLDGASTHYSLLLLESLLRLGTTLEMPIKMWIDAPRPSAFTSYGQPIIQTPTHASYPSGHATEAFAIATVLYALAAVPNVGEQKRGAAKNFNAATAFAPPPAGVEPTLLMRLAARIAENRTVAGVHYPLDSFAGAAMGIAIGEYLVNALSGGTETGAYKIDLSRLGNTLFEYERLAIGPAASDATIERVGTLSLADVQVAPLLQQIWRRARREMQAAQIS